MLFNPERVKQVQEVIFSRGYIIHPPLHFKNAPVKLMHTQKHLDLQLDSNQ